MTQQTDDIPLSWIEKPSVLFTESKLKEFIPKNSMTYKEKLNALTRFVIYVSILLFITIREPFILLIPVCCMVVIYFLVKWGMNMKELSEFFSPETDTETTCTQPTHENPFMNVLLTDERDRKPACSFSTQVKKDVEEKFGFNLYKNVGDIFGKENSQRQFYTVPNTSIPNKQDTLADWLYKTPQTFKEKHIDTSKKYA